MDDERLIQEKPFLLGNIWEYDYDYLGYRKLYEGESYYFILSWERCFENGRYFIYFTTKEKSLKIEFDNYEKCVKEFCSIDGFIKSTNQVYLICEYIDKNYLNCNKTKEEKLKAIVKDLWPDLDNSDVDYILGIIFRQVHELKRVEDLYRMMGGENHD